MTCTEFDSVQCVRMCWVSAELSIGERSVVHWIIYESIYFVLFRFAIFACVYCSSVPCTATYAFILLWFDCANFLFIRRDIDCRYGAGWSLFDFTIYSVFCLANSRNLARFSEGGAGEKRLNHHARLECNVFSSNSVLRDLAIVGAYCNDCLVQFNWGGVICILFSELFLS